MGVLKLSTFGGMIPAVDDRLLPENAAAYSKNAWLYRGTLEGFKAPRFIRDLVSSTAKKVYRIPNDPNEKTNFGNSTWMEFQDRTVNVIRAPMLQDLYSRYYWVGASTDPTYNTLARIQAGQSAYKLGIPQPAVAPVVTPATGGTDPITVSRAYTYTYVSSYGEEGPPATPVNATGNSGETWSITVGAPSSTVQNGRALEKTRLYRTITSSTGVATYYQIAEFPISQTTFSDTLSDTNISGNQQLQSETWTPPPAGLKGWIAMPNGIIAAWKDNEIWFCEPYRPHAWPAAYQVSVDYPIVGCGVMGQTLIVATKGTPWAVTGTRPSTMSLSKINTFEPCQSPQSIISTPEGVYYASPNGLVVAVPGAVKVITSELIPPDKWQSLHDLSLLQAVRFGSAYMAYEAPGTSSKGFVIDATNMRMGYQPLLTSSAIASLDIDPWSDAAIMLRDGKVYVIDRPDQTNTEPYLWRSKQFQFPFKTNLGAMQVYFAVPTGAPTLTTEVKNPTTLTSTMYGIVRVYADGVLRFSRELRTSGVEFRLPSGFKAEFWQIEVEARVVVYNIQVANTSRELRGA